MQGVVRLKLHFRDPSKQLILFSLFHSTPVHTANWKSKWDATKDEGSNQQPSKPYVKYAVRQKRSGAKSALNNLLSGQPTNHYIQGPKFACCAEEKTGRRKDNSRSHSKNSKRSKGNHKGSKRWQNKKSFYDEDEQPETFSGHKYYTWSFGSWENGNYQSSTTGFEWRDDPKWEKAKQRVWRESDVEDDETDDVVDLPSHRIALGLPRTGPLKLDQVKTAFHASALKWHPDRHQGPSQAIAGERFKLCVDAYKFLCNAIKSA